MEVINLDLLAWLIYISTPLFTLVLLYNSPFVVLRYIVHPFPLDVVLSLSNHGHDHGHGVDRASGAALNG